MDIFDCSRVRSGYGVDRTDQSLLAGERPLLAHSQAIAVQEVAGGASSEEDDAFQWFVNLFVAEYASEP